MTLATPDAPVTRERLLEAPLPQLLADLDVTLASSSITDPTFIGAVIVHDGQATLLLPPGRPTWESETIARALLAEAVGVPLSPLPEPYRMAEV